MATTTGLVTRVKHDGNQVYVVIRTTTDELFYLDLSSGGAGDRATKLAMSALLARCFDRKQAVSIEHSSNGSEIVIVDVKPWDVVQWLDGHPTIAQAVKWQTGYSTSTYDIEESAKTAWPQWTAEMRNDLASAFSSAQQWIRSADPLNNLQETLVYPPVNVGEDVATDTATPGVYVSNTYAWDLYVRWLAQNLLVEIEGLVPWSLLDANPDQLQALLDGASMMASRGQDFLLCVNPWHSNYVHRKDNLGATVIGPPRYSYAFLAANGLIGASRLETIGKVLDWARDNLFHFIGEATYANTEAHWQYRGWPPLTRIIEGTTFSGTNEFGHWTAGCHGTFAFIRHLLRALNIPVQCQRICGHAILWFMSEDRYIDHGDDPYNLDFKSTGLPGSALLLDSATFVSWFGPTLDNHENNCDKVGQQVKDLSSP